MAYEDLKENLNYFKEKEMAFQEIIQRSKKYFKFYLQDEEDMKFIILFEDETLNEVKRILIMQKDWGNINNGFNGLDYFNKNQLNFIETTFKKKYRLKNIFQQEVKKG